MNFRTRLKLVLSGMWALLKFLIAPSRVTPPVVIRDEGHTGGIFRVLQDFTLRRDNNRIILNEGDAPILGQYWAGHDYSLTRLNAQAVFAAEEQGLALVLVPPKPGLT